MELSVIDDSTNAERAPGSDVTALTPARLRRIKAAYTTRHVASLLAHPSSAFGLWSGHAVQPSPGDVVVARVDRVGQHKMLESPEGRRTTLYPGDEILFAYGHRYAPDQFEAEVPSDLGAAHLVAAGGVASRVLSAHALMGSPTQIAPVGLLTDARGVLNLARCAPFEVRSPDDCQRPVAAAARRPLTIGVLGTSMNSGKSTTAAAIVRGLTAAGHTVASGKATGTGAGGDPGLFRDSGAVRVLDFTDFGHASTYLLAHESVRSIVESMITELASGEPDAIVIEIADGIFQRETCALVADPTVMSRFDHVVFAAADALGARAGVQVLAEQGIHPSFVSGLLTASPLMAREAAGTLDVPVLAMADLASATVMEHVRRGPEIRAVG